MMISKKEQVFKLQDNTAIWELLQFLEKCVDAEERIDEVERGLWTRLLDVGCQFLMQYVEQFGDGNIGKTIEHNGHALTRSQELHCKTYRSIFGIIDIIRYVYCRRDRQAAARRPLDEKLGLPQGEQSYVVEDWSQRLTVELPYAEAVGILRDMLGIDLSVRAAESMNRKMADHVDSFRDEQPAVNKESEAEILVVTADGKGIPMRRPQEDWLEEELGKKKVVRAPKITYQKTEKRRGRGGRKSRKQMAYVGAVYSIDKFVRKPDEILDEICREKKQEKRPKPQNKRLRAEMNQIVEHQLSPGQTRLFDWLSDEVTSRDPRKRKHVVCLMDGQKSLWYWKKEQIPRAVGILDIYHVLEKLWKAAHCFHPESSIEAEEFVTKYLRMMLEGNIGSVIGVFRRFVKTLRGNKKTNLEEVIRYFHNNKAYMRYDQYLKAGYPIGSGVIEGACRHVVKDRMERTGMRWEVSGAQAMLDLRTTKLNGEWPSFIEHRIEREQQQLYPTNVAA